MKTKHKALARFGGISIGGKKQPSSRGAFISILSNCPLGIQILSTLTANDYCQLTRYGTRLTEPLQLSVCSIIGVDLVRLLSPAHTRNAGARLSSLEPDPRRILLLQYEPALRSCQSERSDIIRIVKPGRLLSEKSAGSRKPKSKREGMCGFLETLSAFLSSPSLLSIDSGLEMSRLCYAVIVDKVMDCMNRKHKTQSFQLTSPHNIPIPNATQRAVNVSLPWLGRFA